MLVLPSNLRLSKLRAFSRGWWRVGDLRNEICGRCFSDTVHQNTDKGSFENNSESKSESEEHTLTVQEPPALLFWGERNTAEVWLELELLLDLAVISWLFAVLTSSRIRLRDAK